MNVTAPIVLTYTLLAASMLALWCPPLRRAERELPPWTLLFAVACASGLFTGLLSWQAVLVLVGYAVIASVAKHREPGVLKVLLVLATGALTLALSLHRFAGFTNPALVTDMVVGSSGQPFTHRLNFDTAAAGLILFGTFCTPARSGAAWREVARQWPVLMATLVVVFALGLGAGYIRFDPKLVALTPVFFLCNLLFTCVTEEAFFRGFLQRGIGIGLQRWSAGPSIALVVTAILFGLAHARGGPGLIALASVAGLGYGYAYLRSGRIEAAILTHFALNAVHFVLFSYPRAG